MDAVLAIFFLIIEFLIAIVFVVCTVRLLVKIAEIIIGWIKGIPASR